VLGFYRNAMDAVKQGVTVGEIRKLPIYGAIAGLKRIPYEKFEKERGAMERQLKEEFGQLLKTKKAAVVVGKREG